MREHSSEPRHPVDLLAEEYAQRLRRGEHPEIEEYVAKYPDHASLIRAVFPSIALVERVSNQDQTGSSNNAPSKTDFRKPDHRIPRTLDDFQIVREIGRGGMGIVYEAVQRSLRRHVALKVVSESLLGTGIQRERFQREAEAAAILHHTNIVPVYGIGEDQGLQYYAMQLIEGVSLDKVILAIRNRVLATETRTERSPLGNESPANLPELNTSSEFDDTSISRADKLHAVSPELPNTRPVFHSEDAASLLLDSSAKRNAPLARSVQLDQRSKTDSSDVQRSSAVEPGLERADQFSLGSRKAALMEASRTEIGRRLPRSYFQSVAKICASIADGLDYAHRQGIHHRDIKPGNLLLDRDGTVWVTDFGLARRDDCDALTRTGEIQGTLRYMAPEQIRGESDSRTDVFSLGLTLFELATLEPAIRFPKERLLQSDQAFHIRTPRSVRKEVPKDLQTIILKACAVEPAHRYSTAAAFEEDLRRFVEDRPILAQRATVWSRLRRWSRRNPSLAAVSASALVLSVALVALLLLRYREQQEALADVQFQFERAETTLGEKAIALEQAERERARAENNLELAIEAFDEVVTNIASRGGGVDLVETDMSDGDLALFNEATLSSADVLLLERLVAFFDRFARENSKDLSAEVADARRRVGDIQQKLGQLENAEQAYDKALEAYRALASAEPDIERWKLSQLSVYTELIKLAAKRGEMAKVTGRYFAARTVLEKDVALNASQAGRFALAQLLTTLGSLSSKYSREPRPRLRGGPWSRFAQPASDEPLPAAQLNRLRREAENNTEALTILRRLLEEDPVNEKYQIALARALKDEVRISRMLRDVPRGDRALEQATEIFESLLKKHPNSAVNKFELADALATTVAFRPADMQRLLRSMELGDQLVSQYPSVPEYQALQASTLGKFASLQFALGRKSRADESMSKSIQLLRELVSRYPDVLLYQMNLVQALATRTEVLLDMKDTEQAQKSLDEAIRIAESMRRQNRLPNGPGPLTPLIERLRDRMKELQPTLP